MHLQPHCSVKSNVRRSASSNVRKCPPRSIAVLRALPGLGDLLCVIPAMRALRVALPQAHIHLVGLNWSQGFVQRFAHYFNGWLEFPGFPGIPEVLLVPQRVVATLGELQSLQLDLVLQMHGSGSSMNAFAHLMGAQQTAGFYPADADCPDRDRFFPYPDKEPEILRHLRLLEFLGIPSQGSDLEFPLQEADWREWEAIATRYHLHKREYLCLHPGASVSARRWSYRGFARLADCLAAEGWQIVLTGTEAEANLTRAIAETMHHAAIDLAGKTTLGGLAVLLKQSRLLVCNDTGVSHLAAALVVPSVVIFSDSDPLRWAPLNRREHRIVCRELVGREQGSCEQGSCEQGSREHPNEEEERDLERTGRAVLLEANHLLQREMVYGS